MDYLDCCNVCEGKINIDDDVIVVSDATVVDEAVVGEHATEFELPDNEPYRKVYCLDCWWLVVLDR
jgi:hypothetical protein